MILIHLDMFFVLQIIKKQKLYFKYSLPFFLNLKINKTLFRLTIFSEMKKENINKLLNKKIYRNIFISKASPKLTFYQKNLIDLNLLYCEIFLLTNSASFLS